MDVIIDPKNKIFGVKYILFCLVVFVWLPQLFKKRLILPKELKYVIVFICFFMPLYALSIGLINSFMHNADNAGMVYYFNSFFFFLLIIIIHDQNYDLSRNFNYGSLFLVLITLSAYFILVFKPSISTILYQYLVIDTGTAVFGLRNYGDYTLLMVWYRTSPLLVFPLSYILHQLLIQKIRVYLPFRIMVLISIILTLLLSGTRANILSLSLIILFYIGYYLYKRSKAIFLIFACIIAIVSVYEISSAIAILFDTQEPSNIIKYGYLISYYNHFSSNILDLFIGQGLGVSFYVEHFSRSFLTSELTYLEVLRVWGLPITCIFMGILIIPIIKELKSKSLSHLFIAYIAYLFIAGTNPFLLDSTGMFVLVYVFSKAYSSNTQIFKPLKVTRIES